MFTKECKSNKYCCFYVSDYHLEMILLPYIKERIKEEKIAIYTEENLSKSIQTLLEKTNLNNEEKSQIMNLNWEKREIENENLENSTIIINGDENYISKINNNIKNMKNTKIIHCYNLNKNNVNVEEIKKNYDGVLNTEKILK